MCIEHSYLVDKEDSEIRNPLDNIKKSQISQKN